MSKSLVFDTLAYAKKLKQAGVHEQQAEIQAEALATVVVKAFRVAVIGTVGVV